MNLIKYYKIITLITLLNAVNINASNLDLDLGQCALKIGKTLALGLALGFVETYEQITAGVRIITNRKKDDDVWLNFGKGAAQILN